MILEIQVTWHLLFDNKNVCSSFLLAMNRRVGEGYGVPSGPGMYPDNA